MEPTQFERLKQALKQQKDRGAITLEEYLEELSSLEVPQVSLQRQGATGAADSAAAADLLRMRQMATCPFLMGVTLAPALGLGGAITGHV